MVVRRLRAVWISDVMRAASDYGRGGANAPEALLHHPTKRSLRPISPLCGSEAPSSRRRSRACRSIILVRRAALGCNIGATGEREKSAGPRGANYFPNANLRPGGPGRTRDQVCCPRKPPEECTAAANCRKATLVVPAELANHLTYMN